MTRALLLLACAACSSVHHGVDAAPIDAPTDTLASSEGDAPPNAVKLTVTRGGMPVPGVAVIFQNADSTLVTAVVTNDLGLAWAEMPSGGYVTAIEKIGTGLDELSTFAAVQQGDALVLDAAPTGARDQWPLAVIVNSDGAAAYELYTSCGGPFGVNTTVATEILLVGCSGVADMVVAALDADGTPVRSYFAPAVALPSSEGGVQTVSLIGTYASLVSTSFTYSGVPSSIEWIGTHHALITPQGRIYERTAGVAPAAGSAVTALDIPAASTMTLTGTTGFSSTEIGQQIIFDTRATAASTYALDLGAAMVPAFATAPAFDGATRTVTWTERGGAAVDAVRVRIHAYRDNLPAGRAWGWRIVAPRAGTTVTYPLLPSFGFDFNPATTDTTGVDDLTTISVPGGYAAIRANGFGDLIPAITSTPGRLVVQSLAPPVL